MEKTVPELMAEISPEDWEKVPASVFNLIQGTSSRGSTVLQNLVK
jgi:hypothetical protein